MAQATFTINEEAIRRKILDAVQSELREKIASSGINNVEVTAVGFEGDEVRLRFTGKESDIKKAKEIFGKSASL